MDADHVLSVLHKGFSAPLVPQGAAKLKSCPPNSFSVFPLSSPAPVHPLRSELCLRARPQLFSLHGGSTLGDCFPSNTTDDCQPYINSPGFRLNSQLPITSQNFPVKYIQFPTFRIERTVFLTYFFMIPSLVRNTPSKPSPAPARPVAGARNRLEHSLPVPSPHPSEIKSCPSALLHISFSSQLLVLILI